MRLPDPVLDVPEQERKSRTWGSDPLIQVQGVGAFVRVMLPIRLTEGHSLTVGTWLAINPVEMPAVWERWNAPEYADLELTGYVANAIPPWGKNLLGATASAAVRNADQNPFITGSSHNDLAAVIGNTWPYKEVLDPYGISSDIHQH
jgi:hypothetical protein